MKKCIKKLVYSSFIAFISIGVNFTAEARVTREVAEATLPYLMEAAGIPEDIDPRNQNGSPYYLHDKIQAILKMIYTDEGQQQMVEWVKTGAFPYILKTRFGEQNTYSNKYYRNSSLAALFPCQTDTFTSFANHDTRVGKHVLKKSGSVSEQIQSILGIKCYQKFDDILHHIDAKRHIKSNDVLLAKVIFTIDVCDSLKQITDALDVSIEAPEQARFEYMCRPVSAIVAKKNLDGKDQALDGDCVETLSKHLIHIAIQDKDNFSKFHTEKLPNELYKYHDSKFSTGSRNLIEVKTISEAGTTDIVRHNAWKEHLKTYAGDKDISSGSLNNIAIVLARVALVEASEDDLQTIKNALNKLATDKTFEVSKVVAEDHAPAWCDELICITEKIDTSEIRKIKIGICSQDGKNKGHAEILQIESVSQEQADK